MTDPLAAWHARWPQAAAELRAIQTHTVPMELAAPRSEAWVQSGVRLDAAAADAILWRNNVGALLGPDGRPVRYGLCNDNKMLNERFKSADLVGIRRVLIQQHHVGHTLGQFVSRECKHEGWKPGESKREVAQQAWATLVNGWGGDAKIVSGRGSFA